MIFALRDADEVSASCAPPRAATSRALSLATALLNSDMIIDDAADGALLFSLRRRVSYARCWLIEFII